MKKIINGKLYDTETAKLIGRSYHGEGPRDFRHYSEELYRKRTGEYFLYGEGGPMSRSRWITRPPRSGRKRTWTRTTTRRNSGR